MIFCTKAINNSTNTRKNFKKFLITENIFFNLFTKIIIKKSYKLPKIPKIMWNDLGN